MKQQSDRAVALVTGGAGGIGSAICRALAASEMQVVVGYNSSADAAHALAENLPGEGHIALPAPVTDCAGLSVLADEIRTRYGRCDVLVN